MRWLDDTSDLMDMILSTLGSSEEQGSLACYSSWGRKEFYMTEQLNNNKYLYDDIEQWFNIWAFLVAQW